MTLRADNSDGVLFSIVICTHDREGLLNRSIRGVLRQQQEATTRSELIVVDSASTDGTAVLLERLTKDFEIQVVRVPVPGLALARNAGIAAANGRYVVFLDDDALPAAGWLSALSNL